MYLFSISPAEKRERSGLKSPSTTYGRSYKNGTSGQTRSTTPSAGMPTNQPLHYSLTVPESTWYQSASGKDDAALRLIHARSATNPRPYLTYTSAKEDVQFGATGLSFTSRDTPKTHTHQPRAHALTLFRVSSTGSLPATRMILPAPILWLKSAGSSKSSKASFHTHSPQRVPLRPCRWYCTHRGNARGPPRTDPARASRLPFLVESEPRREPTV
jgi:hypothetical protein